MTKKIKCQDSNQVNTKEISVRIVKAPLVKKDELKSFLMERAKALVI